MKAMLVSMLAMVLSAASCSDDVAIPYERLPKASRSFVDKHFCELTPLVITKDGNEYEIVFTNGTSVEFDRRGDWKEVSCRSNCVPEGVVPPEVLAKVYDVYPGALVVKIERDRHGFEVRLNVGVELEFDRNYMLRDADILWDSY